LIKVFSKTDFESTLKKKYINFQFFGKGAFSKTRLVLEKALEKEVSKKNILPRRTAIPAGIA
jgi:hypothetical protein